MKRWCWSLEVLKNIIEDIDIDASILLSNVSKKILAKAIEYCKYYLLYKMNEKKSIAMEDEINAWDNFFLKVHQTTLHDLLVVANFLNIKKLYELICITLAYISSNIEPKKI